MSLSRKTHELQLECNKLDWKSLIDYLSSDISNLSISILITVLIHIKHHDPLIRRKYNLDDFWHLLSNVPIPPENRFLSGRVWLYNFYEAYHFASEILDNDKLVKTVQGCIQDFVLKHKCELARVLTTHKNELNKELIDDMSKIFPNAAVTEVDINEFKSKIEIAKLNILLYTETMKCQLLEISNKIEQIFELKHGECKVTVLPTPKQEYGTAEQYGLLPGTSSLYEAKHVQENREFEITFPKYNRNEVTEFYKKLTSFGLNVGNPNNAYDSYQQLLAAFYKTKTIPSIKLSTSLEETIKILNGVINSKENTQQYNEEPSSKRIKLNN